MEEMATLSVEISKEDLERLQALARVMNRSCTSLAAEAICQYIVRNEWWIAEVQKGIDEADRGELIPHEKVVAWIDSLGTDHELTLPEPE